MSVVGSGSGEYWETETDGWEPRREPGYGWGGLEGNLHSPDAWGEGRGKIKLAPGN